MSSAVEDLPERTPISIQKEAHSHTSSFRLSLATGIVTVLPDAFAPA